MSKSSSTSNPKNIVIDWGTTSFRASLCSQAGQQLDFIENDRGISVVPPGTHESELMNLIGEWLGDHGPMTIYALGMITSRNGWIEVPYVSCPASLAELANGSVRKQLSDGSEVVFLAGINDPARQPYPDVMRGEETQIVGFGLAQNLTVVLPGTHSKWARISEQRINSFQTFVTGELYALLSQHSFIAKSGPAKPEPDYASFDLGLRTALQGSPEHSALPTLLFSARTGMLAGELEPGQIRDYVSGLLIGHEFACAIACGWIKKGDQIGIVGNDGLNDRYARAASIADLSVKQGNEQAGLNGALLIAAELEEYSNAA